jgi:hypothetical protein
MKMPPPTFCPNRLLPAPCPNKLLLALCPNARLASFSSSFLCASAFRISSFFCASALRFSSSFFFSTFSFITLILLLNSSGPCFPNLARAASGHMLHNTPLSTTISCNKRSWVIGRCCPVIALPWCSLPLPPVAFWLTMSPPTF